MITVMGKSKPPLSLRDMAAETAKKESGGRGIACPACGCRASKVYRTSPHNGEISRQRVCLNCGRRIATMEISLD